jgi:hypothetical protein
VVLAGLPWWGRRVLAFLRDLHRYVEERRRRHTPRAGDRPTPPSSPSGGGQLPLR